MITLRQFKRFITSVQFIAALIGSLPQWAIFSVFAVRLRRAVFILVIITPCEYSKAQWNKCWRDCEFILVLHFLTHGIHLFTSLLSAVLSVPLCVSKSGTSGQARWFRSTIVIWAPSTPSPLLTRTVGLSAHQTTRVFEFGSGKCRVQPELLMPWLKLESAAVVVAAVLPSKSCNPPP